MSAAGRAESSFEPDPVSELEIVREAVVYLFAAGVGTKAPGTGRCGVCIMGRGKRRAQDDEMTTVALAERLMRGLRPPPAWMKVANKSAIVPPKLC